MARSRMQQIERTLGMATRFLDEVRADIGRAALEGADIPPRLRSVHEKPGHATPEFRTVAIPVPDGLGGVPPEILSGTIARYAQTQEAGLPDAGDGGGDGGDGQGAARC